MGVTWADFAAITSGRSGGGSKAEISVTDMFRLFLTAAAVVAPGLSIENPSVPKTLLVGFRFVGLFGVCGMDGAGETSSTSACGASDGLSLIDSESSSDGNGSRGAFVLPLTHHVPTQSPKNALSAFSVSFADDASLGISPFAASKTRGSRRGEAEELPGVAAADRGGGSVGTGRVAAIGVALSFGTLREMGTSSSIASVRDSARDFASRSLWPQHRSHETTYHETLLLLDAVYTVGTLIIIWEERLQNAVGDLLLGGLQLAQ